MKVLFASSEAIPLAKTGGLGDVAAALPAALRQLDVDARLVMPAYRGTIDKARASRIVAELLIHGQRMLVREGLLPGSDVPLWLIDYGPLYDRDGDPYHDVRFKPWPDNAWRFGCFDKAVAELAQGRAVRDWRADIVHCNDWQTGLVPALLSRERERPRSVFTIHNLAYQGLFERREFEALALPPDWWGMDGVEFHGALSFMKAGIVFGDAITTVSPTYAEEILTPAQGYGLDGCLRQRAAQLSGILNGIDTGSWNPATDIQLVQTYDEHSLIAGKQANKLSLQAELGLNVDAEVPLVGIVGRLAEQKGTDLVLEALPQLLRQPLQLAVLASGDPAQERAWRDWNARTPDRIGVRLSYNEGLAHRIEAGADMFLMPSRFEPCGLNQMYSQAYGTVPLVRRTGGLADTVTDADDAALAAGQATGVIFNDADAGGVVYAVRRALQLFANTQAWRGMQRAGMRRDFSWERSAREYRALYQAH